MQRYVNPHPTMYPQQMQPQMQQPMQQQMPQVVMTPQGPAMMTPNGLVLIPMQQQMQGQQPMQGGMIPMQGGMMPQHGGMMTPGQFPQQQYQPNNQSVVASRFGQPSTAIEPMTNFQPSDNNRYGTPQQQIVPQAEVEEPIRPPLFTVKPMIHKFSGNDKFKMNVITEALKANNVVYEEGHLASDCLEENVEVVIEKAFQGDTTPMLTVRDTIVNNIFHRVDLKEFVTSLVEMPPKEMYKTFKAKYGELTDKHQINVLNTINTSFTDVINDFLAVNSVVGISIESFYTDFNDLLKAIRNSEETLEEDLLDYLAGYLDDMKLALTNTEKSETATHLTEMVSIAYLDRHVLETGLEGLGNHFVQINDALPNAFIKSIAAEVISKVSKQEFLLVTLDKSIFKFMASTAADVYVKKIA